MISAEDARWIISYRGPENLIRAAWRLAGPRTSVAIGIDMRTGGTVGEKWPPSLDRPETPDTLVCAYVPSHRKAELKGLLDAGVETPLSEKAVEEHVVRATLGPDGERFWQSVEEQLRAFEARAGGGTHDGN